MRPVVVCLVFCIFVTSLLNYASSSSSEFNSTIRDSRISAINELLVLIEERIHKNLETQSSNLNETIVVVKENLKDAKDARDQLEKEYQQIQGALSEKEKEIDKADNSVTQAQQKLNDKLVEVNDQKERNQKHAHMELELISRIKEVLGILQERKVKEYGDYCDDKWRCAQGFSCENNICKKELLVECSSTSECVTGLTCDASKCRLQKGDACENTDQCLSALECKEGKCESTKPLFQGFVDWDQDADSQSDDEQDNLMNQNCRSRYDGSRAATFEELYNNMVRELPNSNDSGQYAIGTRPGGLVSYQGAGHSRQCWSTGAPLYEDPDSNNCHGATRAAVCVK
eukprot:gb/GECH01011590.1/.p1 GENE.gb/GECH01011590.1/~~gb/GECH01011590.1/.p1  ORF type:complete len:343 (+),score=92.45 gb/GECH01011590.1/:1-1029(+)